MVWIDDIPGTSIQDEAPDMGERPGSEFKELQQGAKELEPLQRTGRFTMGWPGVYWQRAAQLITSDTI